MLKPNPHRKIRLVVFSRFCLLLQNLITGESNVQLEGYILNFQTAISLQNSSVLFVVADPGFPRRGKAANSNGGHEELLFARLWLDVS